MKTIIITGGGGFVGQILAKKLLSTYDDVELVLVDVQEPPNPVPKDGMGGKKNVVHSLAMDLTDPSASTRLISRYPPYAVYILHGIMSSGSEANLDLGMSVNFDSVRQLLDAVRRQTSPPTISPKVIFTSSCAVNGRAAVENTANETNITPMPESSYGTQKLMIEYLINDYSRRGLLDGRVLRLPTIFVRAGRPTAAASSFVSSIVREPVRGEASVLPVAPDIGIWLSSPATLAKNLIHGMELEKENFGVFRTVLLPGFTATAGEILECLERVKGRGVRQLVREERDREIERIVRSWPGAYDTSRARELGFIRDEGLEGVVREFVEGEREGEGMGKGA